jgi:hypothetical protein
VIAYRAMLDVPRELVAMVAGLLRAERRARSTRRGSRALTCWYQALLVLVWYRKREEMTVLAAGFGVSRATAYRYRDEVVTALHAQAPDLHEALHQVAEQGWSHVIVDGKVFRTDRCAETVTSAKGTTINSWYSGKHRAFGGNVQAVMRPDVFRSGPPRWYPDMITTSPPPARGRRPGALYWSASQLGLPALADSGYEGAGHGVLTPIRRPRDGTVLGVDNQTYNALHRATRAIGERGFALLTTRWRALQRISASPSKIGHIVAGALVLTQFENPQLRRS